MAIISLHQVSKRYPGGFEALKAVSFAVEAGEMLFLTGHSGAGKTTLLKLIAAIERANGGTVLVNGQNVSAMRSSAIPYLRRNLGPGVSGTKAALRQKRVRQRHAAAGRDRPAVPRGGAARARALDKVGLAHARKSKPA